MPDENNPTMYIEYGRSKNIRYIKPEGEEVKVLKKLKHGGDRHV